MSGRVFLLSPANCGGSRARQLLSPSSSSALAARLRSPDGVPLGELFAFVSALYFRGKLAYASRFARPPAAGDSVVGTGVHVITANAGIRRPDERIGLADVEAFATMDIHADNHRFTRPLRQTTRRLLASVGVETEVVLLGSVASSKYVDALLDVFGDQLRFPAEFVGRGDMSRGGLLLRCAAAGAELEYVPVAGARRHGRRPPRLEPLGRPASGPRGRRGGAAGRRE
jgi:hypothetical protein